MYSLSNEMTQTATAEYIAAQMFWLNQTLISATSTGCGGSGCANVVVMSHYRRVPFACLQRLEPLLTTDTVPSNPQPLRH